jgi:hypothetical protein
VFVQSEDFAKTPPAPHTGSPQRTLENDYRFKA